MKKHLYLLFLAFVPFTVLSQTLTFSASRGFYQNPFQLSISSSIAGGTIRYTTDGSAPSTTTGTIYSGPVSINSTSVIRAIGYSGSTNTGVKTQSYIFLNDVIHQPANIPGWPNHSYALGSGSATAVHDYEMDPDVVNSPAYSSLITGGMKSIPTMSLVLNKDDFWALYEGESTFPASVEIIYPDNTTEQFDCGLEPHSHNRLKRSLKLDIETQVNTNLFKKGFLNTEGVATTFKDTKIVLRAGNNRSWARNWNPDRTCYTRDEWYRASQLAVSGNGGRGTFVHLYINGLYWGLYNPVERTDGGMLSNYYGGQFDDWMALDHDGIRSGDATRFNYLTNTLINTDMTVASNYNQLKDYLDVAKFCDYLIITWMTGMTDWPNNNFQGGNRNVPPGPFFYNAWDCEWSWDVTNGSNQGAWVHPDFRNNASPGAVIAKIWHSARRNSDFMQLFADEVYRNCFNNGALTDAASRARWATINNYINTAIIGESARWGDALGDGITRTRDGYWRPEIDRVDGLMNGNVSRFMTALLAQGYYPSLNAPNFSSEGGTVPPGSQLTITNPNGAGTIYYTTDGSDPRLSGGAVAGSANVYSSPVAISNQVTIKSRVKNGSTWSALHQATFTIPNLITGLFINEFVASNTKFADEFGGFDDWIEIYNNNNFPVDLGGLYVSDAFSAPTQWQIPSTSPAITTIPAKGFKVIWADGQMAQGPLHISAKLSKSGEQIALSQVINGTAFKLDSLAFGAQTDDVSMGRSPDGGPVFKQFFAPTPGSSNVVSFKSGLFINEILANNQNSITDELGEHDGWIEIFNNNSQPVDIGGLYLTNNLSNKSLFRIPSTSPGQTTIPAKGFLTLWADNQPGQGILHLGFTLNTSGGNLALTDMVGPDMSVVDSLQYGAQLADKSLGRYPDGSAQLKQFNGPSPGNANVLPAISNLFINEFMASNSSLPDEFGEFDDWIEIYNANNQAVDIGGLFITDNLGNLTKSQIPVNRPDLTTIPAKGFLVVWADEQTVQGPLHAAIKLSAGGEQIGLSQQNGQIVTILDSLTFGAQVTDITRGRRPDGTSTFVNFTTPTPGASNNATNQLPTANAGPDNSITLPVNSVALSGSGSDPEDNTNVTFAWTQKSGPNTATFSNTAVANPTVSNLVAGTYVFELIVKDQQLASSAPDQVTITVNPAVVGQQLVSFTLINANNEQPIQTISNGDVLNLATLPASNLNIRANTNPATVGRVVFALTGAQTRNQTEITTPYALFGDNSGNYNAWVPPLGSYTLTGTPYTASSGGTAGTALTINFSVINQTGTNQLPTANAGPDKTITLPVNSVALSGSGSDPENGTNVTYAWTQQSGPNTATFSNTAVAAPTVSGLIAGSYVFELIVKDQQLASSAPDQMTVTVNPAPVGQQLLSFTLINANTEQPIQTLNSGDVLNLATLPTPNLNIRANTSPATVGRVVFALTGTQTRNQTETGAPYALFGDVSGNYNAWMPPVGSYTLTGTPYTASTGGTAGTALTINFSVINQGSNQVPTANAGPDKIITLPVNSVALSGSGSDPENGSNVTFAWTQQSGPNTATFSNAAVASPTVSGLVAGSYVFQLIVKDQQLASSAPDLVGVTVNPAPSGQQVISFSLINAANEQVIQTLTNGANLNLASLPTTSLNIRANTSPATVGRVVFALSGTQSRTQTETTAPYALFGDNNGNYNAWIPPAGNYTLKATPYTASSGGTAGTALTISFSVTNSAPLMASSGPGNFNSKPNSLAPFGRLQAYPNPVDEGKFRISLPHEVSGLVSYTLWNQAGLKLAAGEINLNYPSSEIALDFAASMQAIGVYYLRLDGKNLKEVVKLLR